MINTVTLVGRIGNDPESKQANSGTAICEFRIAVKRTRKTEGEDTDWFDVVSFGKTAEFVAEYMDRGALVGIEGRLQQYQWQTPEGQNRSRVKIIANAVQALESREEAERRRGRGSGHQENTSVPESAADPFGDINESNDPFGDQ